MLDLLIILPYNREGRAIDWASDYVVNEVGAGRLPEHAKTRMAQGPTQAISALEKDRFREILVVDYLLWQQGITEVWGKIENARLFDKTVVSFAAHGISW